MSGMMMGAAAWQLTGIPWTFDFNSKLTALPTALRRMNATYTRNSVKNVVQDGVLVQLAANQFGTSYDDVTGLYGYVPEAAATNLCLRSEEFDSSSWTITESTIIPNITTAPNGTVTVDKLVPSTNNYYHSFTPNPFPSFLHNTTYTTSVWVGNAGYNFLCYNVYTGSKWLIAYINITTGQIYSASAGLTVSVSPPIGGMRRCAFTWTSEASGLIKDGFLAAINDHTVEFAGDGTSGIYIWGAQLETGSRATSYIATTGSTATRAADVLSVPLANIPGFTAAGYTLYADHRYATLPQSSRALLSISGLSANNTSFLIATSAIRGANVNVNGSTTVSVSLSSASTSRSKLAASFAPANSRVALDGVGASPNLSGVTPTELTTLEIGGLAQGNQPEAFLFNVKCIPQALTQAQINALTVL